MTRPPDYDLGTVEGIVRTAVAAHRASQMAETMARREVQFWPDPSGVDVSAGRWATEAAHHARRLQGVAELVSVSGDLAAWRKWREQGKA